MNFKVKDNICLILLILFLLFPLKINAGIISIDETTDRSIYNTGIYYISKKDFFEATKYFRETLATSTDTFLLSMARLELGTCLYCLGDIRNAVIEFQILANSVANEEMLSSATASLARCYSRYGDETRAIAVCKQLLDKGVLHNPEHLARIHCYIGESYMKMKDYASARENFNEVLNNFTGTKAELWAIKLKNKLEILDR